MRGSILGRSIVCGAVCIFVTSQAEAFSKKKITVCPTCYVWELQEIEQVVYEVDFKTETKKIKVPVIKEIKQTNSCAYDKPVPRTVLKEFPETVYSFRTDVDHTTVHHQHTDECGNCYETCEVVSRPVTCLEKHTVSQKHPVLQWMSVPVADTYEQTFLKPDCEEREVVIETPVIKKKVIKTKKWVRVPKYDESCCPSACAEGSSTPVVETVMGR